MTEDRILLAVVFDGPGGNEVVRVVERTDPVPGKNEVVVSVKLAGINPADIAQREGRYPAPAGAPVDVAGLEVAGIVTECGEGVSAWRVGDRVFGLVDGGGLAGKVVAHERCLAATPEELSEEEAAGVPEAFITAHDALVSVGGFRPGDRVLVTGANGGVGSAALQLSTALGGEVVGASRSQSGRRYIRELGATSVANDSVLGGQGSPLGQFDIILELVGQLSLGRLLDLLAHRGRIVFVGTPAGGSLDGSIRPLLRKRGSLIGTSLRNRPLEEKAFAVQAFAREVVPLFRGKRIHPQIDRCFHVTDATKAFSYLASSGKRGKVLLSFEESGRNIDG